MDSKNYESGFEFNAQVEGGMAALAKKCSWDRGQLVIVWSPASLALGLQMGLWSRLFAH